jgi:hypothetical protein
MQQPGSTPDLLIDAWSDAATWSPPHVKKSG